MKNRLAFPTARDLQSDLRSSRSTERLRPDRLLRTTARESAHRRVVAVWRNCTGAARGVLRVECLESCPSDFPLKCPCNRHEKDRHYQGHGEWIEEWITH